MSNEIVSMIKFIFEMDRVPTEEGDIVVAYNKCMHTMSEDAKTLKRSEIKYREFKEILLARKSGIDVLSLIS